MSHTKEPWIVSGMFVKTVNEEILADLDDGTSQDLAETVANAARIVACVNACAGMTDPVKEVALLQSNSCLCPDTEAYDLRAELSSIKAQRDELRKALEGLVAEYQFNGVKHCRHTEKCACAFYKAHDALDRSP